MADAAENDGVLEAQIAAIGLERVADLDGEFARRREDQHAHAFRRGAHRVVGEVVQDRQAERGGLAGAGLRNAENIPALHDDGDGAGLDRRRRHVVFLA